MAEEQTKSLRVVGGFELITKIGQGGMGTVFKARQISLDRIVALKILPPSIAKDEKFIERFNKEARATAKLNHPNIVQGIDVGQDSATGLWYFAMEFIDGPSVKKVLTEQKTIPEERALEIARQMARALECAHTNGFVHRDVKPDNILLTSRGDAKLADLGLAKHSSDVSSGAQAGQAIGTPYYMAPEQARGAMNEIDIRTDIYALGATLFHLVTGQPPFSAPTSSAILVKHLTEKPPLAHQVAPNVSEACSRLIERMMQKEREKRIQKPAELVTQIEKVLKLGAVAKQAQQVKAARAEAAARMPVSPSPAVSRKRAHPAPPAFAVVVLVGLLVVALLWVYKASKPTPDAGLAAQSGQAQKKPGAAASPGLPAQAPPGKPGPVLPNGKSAPLPPLPKNQPALTPAANPVVPAPEVEAPKADAKKTEAPPADTAAKQDTAAPAASPGPQPTAAAAPAQPAGPDQLVLLAHARFFGEMLQRSAKDHKDLAKVLAEMRELAEKPEFARAKSEVAEELKDLERTLHFEEKAVDALAAAKGELELPEEYAKLAKTGKIIRSDHGRTLVVSVGGADVPLSPAKLPAHKIVEAVGTKTDALAAAEYYLLRGLNDEGKNLLGGLSGEERVRMERKLEAQKVLASEAAAEAAYKDILGVIRQKQWLKVREKILAFEAAHGQTGVGMLRLPTLTAYKEFAEQSSVLRLFHAKTAKMLSDGFVQLGYDFSSEDQLKDFECDHGELALQKGSLKVPEGGGEFAQARFAAHIAELRLMEVTGRALGGVDATPRFGVYILPAGSSDGRRAPRCMFRAYDQKPHLESWSASASKRDINAIGPKEVNWGKDTAFLAEATGDELKWSVNAVEIGTVKLPATAVGGRLAFVAVEGNHVWGSFKIVFKPDPAW
ncbi:MAG: protein kinase, partial [Planctomycetota bacterium]